MRARSLILVLMAGMLGPGGSALGQQAGFDVPQRARRVWELYRQLYYDEAARACDEELAKGGASRQDLVSLLGLKGVLAATRGRRDESVTAFRRMLAVNPRARLMEGQSPRIERAYQQARAWIARRHPIAVASSAPASAPRGGAVTIGLTVASDPLAMAARATLWIRAAGEARYRGLPIRAVAEARWKVEPAALFGSGAALEYHIVITDRDDNVVARAGEAGAPRRIALTGPPATTASAAVGLGAGSPGGSPESRAASPAGPRSGKPWYRSWPFWTIVGVCTAALVVGVSVGAAAGEERADVPVTLGVR